MNKQTVKTIVTITAVAVVGFFGYKIISKKLKELKEGGSNQGGSQGGGGGNQGGGNQVQTPIDANALASSIVLVCRKRYGDALIASRREFLTELKNELPNALIHVVNHAFTKKLVYSLEIMED